MPEVTIVTEVVKTVQVETPGLQGRPGSPGYDHVQASPETMWTINHNLGVKPSVQTFSIGGVEITGSIHHLSLNTVIVTFNVAVAGFARLV